ncbi:unnamed protein product [Mytilus edulis]|uniref:C-type lectin domain-containing protein n=1 Tax=Mytilus edulis TaxID=6550 RepID=A0A8S3QSE8_MYTED|nr:unnamed protein product [Mytilus edulis]
MINHNDVNCISVERHSDFEIRIHNTSDWSSQYSLCYKQIGQAPTEININCIDRLSGKYLTVYKKDDYRHYPLVLCEVEVYGNENTGNTINTYISMSTTLTISNGNHKTHESRPTTLGTSLTDHKTHENNLSTSFNIHGKTTECNGWDFVYYNGLCMLFSTIDLDWFEARTYCENKNSHLLVLDSEQKVNETKEFLKTYYHDLRSLYVGASDETKEGEWKWVTKTTISGYFNFQPGQPNNIDSNHPNKVANCGAVMSKGQLDLYDVYCYGKRKFICEM